MVCGAMSGWPIPITQTLLTYLGFVAIIILRYFIIVWPIHHMLWRRPESKVRARRLSKREPTREIIRHEIKLSTLSAFIYAAPAAIIIEMWKAGGTALYSGSVNGLGAWAYLVVSIFIYMAVQDTYFYWTHRIMHHKKIFSWAHAGHHKSVQPTPWASFSFDPFEAAISAWLLPVLALFVPLHVGAALFLLMLMTINAVFNHAGWEAFPERWVSGPYGKVMITAAHHNLHHTKFRGNYGLYFRFWDQIMGTDHGQA